MAGKKHVLVQKITPTPKTQSVPEFCFVDKNKTKAH
jgi:hypothetical protein